MKIQFKNKIMLSCLMLILAISQNIYGQKPCNSRGWTEKIINVGEPNTFVDFLAGSVTLDITDGNKKSTSTGSYLQIHNYGDQPIEWVTYGNSPYTPVGPDGRDGQLLPIYRTKTDLTPTKVTVVIRYCGNTKATYPSQQGNSQNSNNQSKKTTSNSANESFPIGCWKFTYVDPDNKSKIHIKLFKSDNTVTYWELVDGDEKQLKPYPTTWKWGMKGGDIVITSAFNGTEEPLRFNDGKLRGWYSNDNGDTPSNIRYYGVKDNDACSGLPTN